MRIFVKDMRLPLLLDLYGALLTERKRELLDYYYNEDYSLAEISELTGLSRQGVRDAVKKGEEELYALEKQLCLSKWTAAAENASAALEPLLSSEDPAVRESAERALSCLAPLLGQKS